MKLIIDIPDGYEYLSDIKNGSIASANILNAVKNGKLLPKVYGRLIDEQALVDIIERKWKNKQITNTKYNTFLEILDYVPSVLEVNNND